MLRSRSTLPPYLTSGAASRSHHALLVKLHEAASEQEQEDILAAEVRRIKLALSTKDSSSSKTSEHLLILLHIASMRKRTGDDIEFALVPALQLAEGGKTIKERRLGYLFLSERLPPSHELNLMLVNTIRKDLSSQKTSHILLALHTIVKLPARELSPAVTPILVSSALLKHPEGAVRQRTLEALQALHTDAASVQTGTAGGSVSRPTFPLSMSKVTRLLAKERDASVAAVIFRLMSQMIKSGAHTITSEEERLFLVEQVDRTLAQLELGPDRQLARDAVSCLGVLMNGAGGEVKAAAAATLIGLLHPAPSAKATLLEICRLASIVSSEKLTNVLFARARSLMSTLSSSDPDAPSSSESTPAARPKPNDHILALRCLDVLKEESWAGRLGEEDMAAVMEGMSSPDDTIRRATLRLLHQVDSSLTRSALQSLLDSLKNASDLFLPLRLAVDSTVEQKTRAGIEETVRRCLEVAEVRMKDGMTLGTARDAEAGNAYAGEVAETLDAWTVAQQVTGDPGYQVWDDGVAIVMDHLRQTPDELSSTAARRLVVGAKGDEPAKMSPTQQVLGCEACAAFAGHDELEASEIISAVLAMTSYTSGLIRDQAFVAAFAILVKCTTQEGARDRLSQEMLSRLDSARDGSGRINSRRADQLRFLIEHNLLEAVVEETRSRALADLALAIDSVHARESAARHRKAEKLPENEEPKDRPTRPRDLAASQLRYDAYDAPPSR